MLSKDIFFTIVIPAHNEDEYIETALRNLQGLEYPNDSYEIIVVEAGSTDWTYDKAKPFVGEQIQVVKIPEADVSKARNHGAVLAKQESDWVLFLDADTLPDTAFLRTLSNFLKVRSMHAYLVGTFELQPIQASFTAKMLYGLMNFGFRKSRISYANAMLIKRGFIEDVSFEENLVVKQNNPLAEKLSISDSFFFFSTTLLQTSTRRVKNDTWTITKEILGKCLSANAHYREPKISSYLLWE